MLGILKLLLHKYSCGKAGSLPACAVLAFVRGALCGGKDKHNTELVVGALDGKQCFWDIKSATERGRELECTYSDEICSSIV